MYLTRQYGQEVVLESWPTNGAMGRYLIVVSHAPEQTIRVNQPEVRTNDEEISESIFIIKQSNGDDNGYD